MVRSTRMPMFVVLMPVFVQRDSSKLSLPDLYVSLTNATLDITSYALF